MSGDDHFIKPDNDQSDPPCTDCDDSGIAYQTERYCTCHAGQLASAHSALANFRQLYAQEGRKALVLQEQIDLITAREQHAQATLARVRKLRDEYASQAKFADHEPAAWFREFVRRLDAAVAP